VNNRRSVLTFRKRIGSTGPRTRAYRPQRRALACGHLANAAFDVWYRYPTEAEPTLQGAQPFHELGNVIMTLAGRKACSVRKPC
jgi:hypothetical protein